MKISVLMSVYKEEQAKYLDKAIESIIDQTQKPNQIVIIKDGKLTNELEEVIARYKNRFPKLIDIYELEKNSGLGVSLRYGIKKCKYEYVARMDTDDVAPKYRLEEQIRILKDDPSLDILGGYIEEYDENMKELISIRKVPLTLEKIQKHMKTKSPFNHGTVIMKRETVLRIGNYRNVKIEDYDLWARMLINGCKMANMDIVLGKNRTGKTMYKKRSGMKYIRKIVEIENKLLEYKIINKVTYIKNVIIRSAVAIVPVKLKKFLYKEIIRKI